MHCAGEALIVYYVIVLRHFLPGNSIGCRGNNTQEINNDMKKRRRKCVKKP